jgi:ATP-binding cassette subfamily B protein
MTSSPAVSTGTAPPATDPDLAPSATPEAQPEAKPRLGSLRALWPFVRKHAGLFVAWLIALVLASAATLSLPMAVRQIIDHGFSSGDQVDRAFLSLFGVAVVLALASAARFYFVSLLGERVVADLRQKLYGHLMTLGAGFHDRTRSGELVSRLSADSELLRNVVSTSMSVALRSSVTVIGGLTMLFITSPRLASFALIGIPAAVLPIVLGSRRLG